MSTSPQPCLNVRDIEHLSELRKVGQPLFGLGVVYATPAVFMHLLKHSDAPANLLEAHQRGDYGSLGKEDCAANDLAVIDGSRILSAYDIGGERIYIITEAAGERGARSITTLLFAREY